MEEAVKFLDIFLEGHEFVIGNNLTVADIPLIATITTYEASRFDLSPYKNVTRWYSKVKEVLPGFDKITGKEMLSKMYEPFFKNK